MHPYFSEQLARERASCFEREADSFRLRAAARAAARRPDLAAMQFRVLEPADAHELARLYEGLSRRARYLRFMTPWRTVPASVVSRLAAVDHHHHEAVGAFLDRRLVGSAHYFESPEEPGRAEIAAEVADPYQHVGIGTRLLCELGRLACARGVTQFLSTVLVENTAALGLLRKTGWPAAFEQDGPVLAVTSAIAGGCGP